MARSNDRPKPAPVVAELGRPETPEEVAARKAETSRKHRANQTTINLVLSIIASLGVVVFLMLVVVRPDPAPPEPVDYRSVAEQAQQGVDETLAVPVLPPGWRANRAELERVPGGGLVWYLGLLTPEEGFIALEQGVDVSTGWLPLRLDGAQPTGTERIGGVSWQVYDQRASNPSGNFAYSLVAEVDGNQYLLHGSAAEEEFRILATALAAELGSEEQE